MSNRVIALAEIDSAPVISVPGTYVTPQAGGNYTLHGPEEPAPAKAVNKLTHPTIARLYRVKPGLYAVDAESAVLDALDKDGKGKTMAAYSLTASAATWPVKQNGVCVIPSTTGRNDSRPVKTNPRPAIPVIVHPKPEDPDPSKTAEVIP